MLSKIIGIITHLRHFVQLILYKILFYQSLMFPYMSYGLAA